jgi:hypothetical protein
MMEAARTSEVIALMMEAAKTSGTLVNFHQTTRRYNPEDSHFLKSITYWCDSKYVFNL